MKKQKNVNELREITTNCTATCVPTTTLVDTTISHTIQQH